MGAGALEELPRLIPRGGRGLLVTDTNVGTLWGAQVRELLAGAGLPVGYVELPPSEEAKSFGGLRTVIQALAEGRVARDGWIVALGGGAVGDVAGFAAAIWLRGIAFYQAPTTLLAMVDASIGGKTGINWAAKNSVGAFWQPQAVVSDLRLLASLPDAEYGDGFAEVIKYGAALDADLFAELPTMQPAVHSRQLDMLQAAVTRCARLKADLVAIDERDEGPRAVLNYGHTVGHALEALSGYSIRHGAAVAVGMRAAARISVRMKLCDRAVVEALDDVLRAYGLGEIRGDFAPAEVLEATRSDKKSRSGTTGWVLLRGIGRAEPAHEVPEEVVLSALRDVL